MEQAPRGQVLVIFAVSLIALIAFVGLAVDAGSLYVTYGQLKRAVDTAAVAAANEFKRGSTVSQMSDAALEILRLQNVDVNPAHLQLQVFICYNSDGTLDTSLQTTAPQFYARCPNPANGEVPRKLVWIDAHQKAPLYFLSLIGVTTANLETNAIAEAASVNLVIVLDTSGSMADELDSNGNSRSPGFDKNHPSDYDPNAPGNCNNNLTLSPADYTGTQHNAITCYPLRDALDAAAALVGTLYDNYDEVGIVTFSKDARFVLSGNGMTKNMETAINAIYTVQLSPDMAFSKLWQNWQPVGRINPVNIEDLDGDNLIDGVPTHLPTADHTCTLTASRWDTTRDPFAWGGFPCNDDTRLDAFDWNGNGTFEDSDEVASETWLKNYVSANLGVTLPAPHANDIATISAYWPYMRYLSFNDTCTGCGIRVGANLLKSTGNPSSVWVMIFLSDGVANLSDTSYSPGMTGVFPFPLPEGFCGGTFGSNNRLWAWGCINYTPNNPRYCIEAEHGQPGHINQCALTGDLATGTWATYVNPALDLTKYTPEDYARDQIDQTALLKSNNPNEPAGNDIAVYTIGLGAVGSFPWTTGVGNPGRAYPEGLLRYMAAVGDDGDRNTDPCAGIPEKTSCGNYYYAAKGDALRPIFDDIASRIYTRITQ